MPPAFPDAHVPVVGIWGVHGKDQPVAPSGTSHRSPDNPIASAVGGWLLRSASNRRILRHLGERWSLPLLLLLRTEPSRFEAIKGRLSAECASPKISGRMLTYQLRQLQNSGLVERQDVPARNAPYALTALGREFLQNVEGLLAWIEKQRDRFQPAE